MTRRPLILSILALTLAIFAGAAWFVSLRANKRETFDWLKFTLEGEGERTHGYAFTDTAFARYRV
jgi:hypothetical protein